MALRKPPSLMVAPERHSEEIFARSTPSRQQRARWLSVKARRPRTSLHVAVKCENNAPRSGRFTSP